MDKGRFIHVTVILYNTLIVQSTFPKYILIKYHYYHGHATMHVGINVILYIIPKHDAGINKIKPCRGLAAKRESVLFVDVQ